MNNIQKSILSRSIKIRLDRGEDVAEVFKKYTNLTEEEKAELLGAYGLTITPDSLAELKAKKIAELSSICQSNIENGVTIEIDGVQEHFTYGITNGDQGNIDDLFDLVVTTNLSQPYHCSNGSCKLYTPDQIKTLYIAVKTLKVVQTTYFNQIKQMIKDFTEDSDIETIKGIQYGYELTGKYLENYNAMLAQGQTIIEARTSSLSTASA